MTYRYDMPITWSHGQGKFSGLAALTQACRQVKVSLDVVSTAVGSYVRGIGDHEAVGNLGWKFAHNGGNLRMALSDLEIKNGDRLICYYGDPDTPPY